MPEGFESPAAPSARTRYSYLLDGARCSSAYACTSGHTVATAVHAPPARRRSITKPVSSSEASRQYTAARVPCADAQTSAGVSAAVSGGAALMLTLSNVAVHSAASSCDVTANPTSGCSPSATRVYDTRLQLAPSLDV